MVSIAVAPFASPFWPWLPQTPLVLPKRYDPFGSRQSYFLRRSRGFSVWGGTEILVKRWGLQLDLAG